VVNLGQFCMSTYWDLLNTGEKGNHVDELLKKVDIMTVLSGIAIDMAKKFYDIDMDKEINEVSKNKQLNDKKKKPKFWVFVSQSNTIKNRVEFYKCPMDYLIFELEGLDDTPQSLTIPFDEIINDFSTQKINIRQMKKVEELILDYSNEYKTIQIKHSENKRSKLNELENQVTNKLKSWKLKADTISMILKNTYVLNDELLLKTLKLLHECHSSELLKVMEKQ